jgi:hypothetical protein
MPPLCRVRLWGSLYSPVLRSATRLLRAALSASQSRKRRAQSSGIGAPATFSFKKMMPASSAFRQTIRASSARPFCLIVRSNSSGTVAVLVKEIFAPPTERFRTRQLIVELRRLKAITPPRKVRLRASFRLSCMKDLLEYSRHQRITAPVRNNRPLALALIPDEIYQSAYWPATLKSALRAQAAAPPGRGSRQSPRLSEPRAAARSEPPPRSGPGLRTSPAADPRGRSLPRRHASPARW